MFSVRHCFPPSFTGAQNCTLRRSRRSTCLAACWPPLNCLWATLGSTLPWLATIPPLPCSTRHLPVLTPCLDRCFTFTSQILRRNLRTLFLVSFKTAGRRFFRPPTGVFRPPTGVFSTTDRLPTGYRPATDRLPPATDRLPPATDRLPPATDRLPPATDRLPPATDRLPPATDRLPTGYRPATAGYRPATAGYLRLPPATNRLPPAPTGYRRLPKKKKKICQLRNATRALYKQSSRFGDWEMPIVPKQFSGHVLHNEDCMCVSLYIWTLNT